MFIGSDLQICAEDTPYTPLDLPLKSGGGARLIAYLVLSGKTTLTKEEIERALWQVPERDVVDKTARARQAVRRLLQSLGRMELDGFLPLVTYERARGYVSLNHNAYVLDYDQARVLYQNARQAKEGTSASREKWGDFVECCRPGDILSGWAQQNNANNRFLVQPRKTLARQRAVAFTLLAEDAERNHEREAALTLAQRAIDCPVDEPSVIARAEAVVRRITKKRPAPPLDSLSPMAESGAKALCLAEPPAEDVPRPLAFPFYGNSFWGRDEEIALLKEYVDNPAVRMITLCGTAGVGKTRLLAQWAADCRKRSATSGHSSRSLFLVDLASVHHPAQVPGATLDALTLPLASGNSAERIAAFSRRLHRPIIMFDNAEHLLPPPARQAQSISGSAHESHELPAFFEAILSAAHNVTIIVTSRQATSLPAEYPLLVEPLSPPISSTPDNLAQVRRWKAAGLFVERVNQARASMNRRQFRLTKENAPTVARIVRLLDGLPLALELVAGNMGSRRLSYVKEVMEKALTEDAPPETMQHLTTSRSVGGSTRHASLQAAFSFGYHVLLPHQKLLFARLSVFQGGATLPTIEAICLNEGDRIAISTRDDLHRELENFVRCSLLQVRLHDESADDWAVSSEPTETRYSLLETVRVFGKAVLPQDERNALSHRHAEYFSQLARSANRTLYGPDAAHGFAILEAERANLDAALMFLMDAGQTDLPAHIAALRFAGDMHTFWYHSGYVTEAKDICERLLAQQNHQQTNADWQSAQVEVLTALAWLHHNSQSFERALSLARQGLDLAIESDASARQTAELWRTVGVLETDRARAKRCLRTALDLSQASGDDIVFSNTLHVAGSLAVREGNLQAAYDLYQESLKVSRRIGCLRRAAVTLGAIGSLLAGSRRFDEALPLLDEALATQKRLKSAAGVALAGRTLANFHLLVGNYLLAHSLCKASWRFVKKANNKVEQAVLLCDFGRICFAQKNERAAHRFYVRSLRLFHEMNEVLWASNMLMWLGVLAGAAKKLEDCVTLCYAGLTLCQQTEYVIGSYIQEEASPFLDQARDALGAAAFTAAQDKGKRMSREAAAAYAGILYFPRGAASKKIR